MIRLPLMLAGLAAGGAMIAVASTAFGDVSASLGSLAGDSGFAGNQGPLIIHVQRSAPAGSSSIGNGPDAGTGILEQTRCILHWDSPANGARGRYDKSCTKSTLPR